MGRYHGEAARSALAIVRGVVFARFIAVAAKRRSRTQNSRFGLFGPVLRAATAVRRHQSAIFWIPPLMYLKDFNTMFIEVFDGIGMFTVT
jgi:hypothetical protein